MKYDKIAIFDLDGTLWTINSHYEILNMYYSTTFYKSFLFRLLFHFFKNYCYKFIWKQYNKIPKSYVEQFNPAFNEKYVKLLLDKQDEGFFCVIVSNAPVEIVMKAAQRLGIPFIRADVCKKLETLKTIYDFNKLFVCTDNIEDIDLISAADDFEIVQTKNNFKFFKEKGLI